MKDLMNNFALIDPLRQHKDKWEALASENDRYYVRSVDHEQSDDEYEASGLLNVTNFIANDSLVLKHISPFAEKVVLEIGCGSGRITKSLCGLFKHVFAIDISTTMLRKAREFVESQNVTFLESDGSNVPVAPNSVNFAFSYIVYQHFPSRDAVRVSFQGVYCALKAGGVFKVQLRGEAHPDNQHWSWGPDYDLAQASELAAETGFEILYITANKTRSRWLILQKPTDRDVTNANCK